MTSPGLENIDAVYQYLTSDVIGAAEKKCCLQERALELLPRLVDQLCLPGIASPSSQLHAQSSHVLHYLLDNASPKELSLTLETELERAIDEIAECFFVDEDSSTTEEQQDEDQQKSQGQTHTKTLQFVSKRICVALDSHRCVLDRLAFKTSKAGILVIQGFLQRLEDFLVDLMQAINEGEALPPSSSSDLCTAVAAWCRHAFTWTSKLTPAPEELDSLQVSLANVLLKYLVMLHSRMGLLMLERGYSALYPETLLSKQAQAQSSDFGSVEEQAMSRNTIIEALDKLGITPESYSRWMHREDETSYDDRLVFFPIAALVLTSWGLVNELEGCTDALPENTARPDGNTFADVLSMSMPLLGSALNGLAKDSGHLWVWYLVNGMRNAQQHADLDDVSMLIELLMPNLAGDPSEASRYALHRLTSALISLVREAKDRVVIFQQLISTENPFLSVRLSSLALLREEIATAIRSHETDFIVHPDTFWSGLAPLIFALPTADLPLLELPLDSVLQDRIIPWCMECAKILLLLLSCGSEAEESCRRYVEQSESLTRWIIPLKECLARWESEASSDGVEDMDTTMLLYSLRWTLEQVEGKLDGKNKVEKSL